jgi:hypothetical protein
MFEIDENTKYSLRLIGRGSLILVSLALVFALIGYFLRDDRPGEPGLPQYTHAELRGAGSDTIVNKRIILNAKVDSLFMEDEQVKALLRSSEDEPFLSCRFNADISPDDFDQDKMLAIEGLYLGLQDGLLQMDNCRLLK